MQAFATLAHAYLPQIDAQLSACVTCEAQSVSSVLNHVLSTRGKRLRPLLAISSALVTGDVPPAVLDVACAVELVHTASLVHDDVIDRSQERRGVVTINAKWGNHTAVLAGDILLSQALNMLTPYANLGAVDVVSDAISKMCESEIDQAQSQFDADLSEQRYLKRIAGKTASLLRAACLTGARVAGAPAAVAGHLADFGHALGIAFQISDDVLDFLSDAEDMGKPTCADLKSGVVTLPIIYLLQDAACGQYTREALLARSVTRKMRRILKDLEKTGALTRAIMLAMDYVRMARSSLSNLPEGPGKSALEGALYLVENRSNLRLSERDVLTGLGVRESGSGDTDVREAGIDMAPDLARAVTQT